MMQWVSSGRRLQLAGVAALLLGCGSADSEKDLFEPVPQAPSEPEPPEAPPEQTETPPTDETPDPPPAEVTPPVGPTSSVTPPGSQTSTGVGCKPARGVSGSPETISQAIILMNTLPRPTTLACFIEALDRPLTLYMTKSDDSLQPSPGARSPRTFILRGDMEMSVVLDGSARDTLEFGYRYEPGRTIKAEVAFPLTKDVNERSLFDRVQVTPRTTKCGACHVGEDHEDYPGFPLGVFASDVLEPFDMDVVTIDSIKAEHASCDATSEEYRCGLLAAIFDHGDVVSGALRGRDE
jgi:hypothetical protein